MAFGVGHAVMLDRVGQMWGWGDGAKGCLGFGDGKKRQQPAEMTFFKNKRVIDVSCGDSFSVVIAEVEGNPLETIKHDFNEDGLLKKTYRLGTMRTFEQKKDDGILKSIRQPLCGGQDISTTTRDKIMRVINRNRQKKVLNPVDAYTDQRLNLTSVTAR